MKLNFDDTLENLVSDLNLIGAVRAICEASLLESSRGKVFARKVLADCATEESKVYARLKIAREATP